MRTFNIKTVTDVCYLTCCRMSFALLAEESDSTAGSTDDRDGATGVFSHDLPGKQKLHSQRSGKWRKKHKSQLQTKHSAD